MEGNKISFGFKKTKKADKPVAVNSDERREYIECVEEQSIKVVGGETEQSNEPLVIPMKPNSLITSERLLEIALKVESGLEEPEINTESVTIKMEDPLAENETLDQMAERELMQEAKKNTVTETPTMEIPSSTKGVAGGEKESTLDDYEAIPVKDFGVAMLRGMGWTPGKEGTKYKPPELRPKGLGLGADKVIKAKQQASKDSKPEDLVIVKNSYVKIISGKYSDYYGKVVSLDEDNGRVVVDIPVKKETVSLSEFMMSAVTKSEYDRESKVINADSYGEYKRKEQSQKSADEKSLYSQRRDDKERDRRDEKEKDRRDEKEGDSRDERERDRRDEKERDRRDEKERERRDDKERDRRDEKERNRRDEKERDRKNDKEKDRRDEKERDRRDINVRDRRDDRERDRRDVRERDRRDEKEPERRERKRDEDSGDYRKHRDQDSANGKSNNRYRRDSSSSGDRSSKKNKEKERDSSSDSLSANSDDDRKGKKHKSRKRRSRSRSDSRKRSPALEAKKDIDKKRKGKKKKRDRDRSPNYKKHRK